MAFLIILGLAWVQNVSFSLVSRSRNRDHKGYHVVAATISNTIWFLTMRQLVLSDLSVMLLPAYVTGTVIGSLNGMTISMWIERKLGATADGHVVKGLTP